MITSIKSTLKKRVVNIGRGWMGSYKMERLGKLCQL